MQDYACIFKRERPKVGLILGPLEGSSLIGARIKLLVLFFLHHLLFYLRPLPNDTVRFLLHLAI